MLQESKIKKAGITKLSEFTVFENLRENNENMLEKKHKKYQCEQCETSFEYQYILKKHKLVSHEDTNPYYHFFNNAKTLWWFKTSDRTIVLILFVLGFI